MIWRVLAAVLAVAAAAAAVPALRHLRELPPAAPRVIRASFTAPSETFLGNAGGELDAAITADGQQVVFAAMSGGVPRLWHRRLDDDRTSVLPGTEGGSLPAWKPGGRAIAFFADGQLKQFSFEDRSVAVLGAAPTPAGAAWRDDGSLLFVPDSRGPVKSMRNGVVEDATQFRDGDRGHLFPAVAGDAIVYMAEREDGTRVIRHASADGESELGRTSSHATLIDDALVYVRDSVLVAQRFDAGRLALTGRPTVLSANVGVSTFGHGFYAVAGDVLISRAPGSGGREIAWIDEGQRLPVMEPADYWQLRLSPDNRHIAVTATDPLLRSLDVFAIPAARPGEKLRMSLSLGPDMDPIWTTDGQVVYRSQQAGSSQLLSRLLAPGMAPPELVVPGSSRGDVPTDWRRGTLLVHATHPDTRLDLHAITAGQRRQVTTGAFNEWDARFSPDGRWVAYVSDESGQAEVYVDAWPEGGRRLRVTVAGGRRPQWLHRGFGLLFVRGDSIHSTTASVAGGRVTFATPQLQATVRGLIDYAVSGSDRLLALFPSDTHPDVPVQMTISWKSLLPTPPQ